MGVPDKLGDLRAVIQAARDGQIEYWRSRGSVDLAAVRVLEQQADRVCEAVNARSFAHPATGFELARAYRNMRRLQRQYFQRRGDVELREAKAAERELDRMLSPVPIDSQPHLF